MKIYRIVTDSYAGYEAQVKYSFLPFVWFQMNAEKSVNTWNTREQAMEFIRQKKAGTYSSKPVVSEEMEESEGASELVLQYDFAVKSLLAFSGLRKNKKVIWQESYQQQPSLPRGMFQPAY